MINGLRERMKNTRCFGTTIKHYNNPVQDSNDMFIYRLQGISWLHYIVIIEGPSRQLYQLALSIILQISRFDGKAWICLSRDMAIKQYSIVKILITYDNTYRTPNKNYNLCGATVSMTKVTTAQMEISFIGNVFVCARWYQEGPAVNHCNL